ncbi:deleted in azoospermia-like [Corythoichthys intestinalis]|uniref:deleted in azoospermia-like n=1 Tax=Corythoichthys intestinalis TaxID=161448 RepID=UPI0025A62985|nr:deleted in azoospermia-like [Corythoichthys intestinalis]
MDNQFSRGSNHNSPSSQLDNGYILPEGTVTPHAIFVGGIDTRVNTSEMREFFASYGTIKEVKIITFRGGLSKGYGFVYFTEDVDINSIVDQNIIWKGKTLKLGPAINKQRNARYLPPERRHSRLVEPWMRTSQYAYCNGYPTNRPRVNQTVPFNSGGGSPYYPVRYTDVPYTSGGSTYYQQPYCHSQYGSFIVPQMPVNQPNPYAYQYYVPYWTHDQNFHQGLAESGVQTMLTV